MSFPRYGAFGLLLALVLAVSACGGSGEVVSSSGSSDEQQLTVAVAEQFDGFDSTSLAATDVQAGAMRQLYDTLVALDADREPQPRLAESWTFSPDRGVMTLKLRDGLKFSDGSPLAARDVVWNIEHAQREETAATARPLFMAISKATAPDAQTVRLQFQRPLAAPFDMLDYLFVAKPQDTPQQLKTRPIGTGPFMLGRWTPGSEVVLEKNPNFWVEGQPKLDRVVFKFASDAQGALMLFRSRQADFLFEPSAKDFVAFTRDDAVQTLTAGDGGRVPMFMMNVKKPPFDDVRVRQAVAAALDRDAMIDTVFHAQGTAWCLPWPEGSIGFEASPELARDCPADPEKARALLREAGFPDGITTSNLTTPMEADVTQVFQQQLAAAGIEAKVDSVETAVFFDRAIKGDWSILTSTVQRVAHDSGTSILLGVPLQNGGVSGFESEEYGRLIDEVLYDTNPETRKASMARLNEYLLEQAFIVPMTSRSPRYVFTEDVAGVETTLDGYLIFENVDRTK